MTFCLSHLFLQNLLYTTFLGSFPFKTPKPNDTDVPSNIFRHGSMVTYAAPDTSGNHKADYSAHFDNFEIKVLGQHGPHGPKD